MEAVYVNCVRPYKKKMPTAMGAAYSVVWNSGQADEACKQRRNVYRLLSLSRIFPEVQSRTHHEGRRADAEDGGAHALGQVSAHTSAHRERRS